ncbi:MAG TPA: LapA family protein [Actinomycetota bacterium]|nr:LapA family protein [Actinomycetota bacterium]
MPDSVAALGAGFLVAWLAMSAYLIRLWRKQRRISERIDALEREHPGPSR